MGAQEKQRRGGAREGRGTVRFFVHVRSTDAPAGSFASYLLSSRLFHPHYNRSPPLPPDHIQRNLSRGVR